MGVLSNGGALQASLATWKAEIGLNNFARKKGQGGWAWASEGRGLAQPYALGHLDGKGRRENFTCDG